MSAVLGNISKQITQGNISQQFYIEGIRVVLGSNVVYVDGTLNEYIDKNLSTSVAQTYRLTYHIQNYGAQLDNLELVDKDDPQLKDLKNVE